MSVRFSTIKKFYFVFMNNKSVWGFLFWLNKSNTKTLQSFLIRDFKLFTDHVIITTNNNEIVHHNWLFSFRMI